LIRWFDRLEAVMNIDISGDALRLLERFIDCASAHPERLADAMRYDPDGFSCHLRCLGKAFHEALDSAPQKKARGSKKEPLPLPDDFDRRFPEPLGGKIKEWLAYKTERRDFYRPTGFRNLLLQIEKRMKNLSAELVADLISECMANNWAGIIWDRIERLETRLYSRYGSRSASRRAPSELSPWSGFLFSEQDDEV
jgi:hypothetical protein